MWAEPMAARGYTGGFGADLMLKDLGLALDAAKHAKKSVVLGAVAQQLFQMFSARGAGVRGFLGYHQALHAKVNPMNDAAGAHRCGS